MNINKNLLPGLFTQPATKKKPAKSHLTHALNHKTHKAIRWCTPSIDLTASQVKNPYASDTSISYESLGYPSEPSGVFKKIFDQAAKAYGADHTLFSVNGTTGSNFIVLRTLSKQIPNLRILAQRNVHKSIVTACEDYGINLLFLSPNIDQELKLFLPNTEHEILEGIRKTKPQVVLLTNPTYEGFVLNLRKVIESIRKEHPEIIVFIEEAWGAHLHFSEKLPVCAMDAKADICVQSTHKQGGSLQQSGMIHWNEGRINSEILMDTYRDLLTTSPSYLLMASLDAARELMEKKGEIKMRHILTLADLLKEKIGEIDSFEVVDFNEIKKRNNSVYAYDGTKVVINVAKAGYNGFEVAKILEHKFNIVVESYNIDTILILVPFRATIKDVEITINALKEIGKMSKHEEKAKLDLKIPTKIPRILELKDVTKLFWNQIEKVPLSEAVGRIAAEHITPFPPGIPITIKGEVFTKEIVNYYLTLRTYPNAHILARDKYLETVWVVK